MPNNTSYRRAPAVIPLVAATACWGAGTVVTKQVLHDVAPLTLLPMQLTASCLLLFLLCLVRRERIVWSPPTRRLAALGVLNPGLAYALGLLGLASITASLSVLLWAAEPVLIVVFAVVLLRERVPAQLVTTLAVAVLGVVLVVYQPGASGDARGVLLTLVAVGCCALYTVATRQLLLDDAALPIVLTQQLAALAFAVLLPTAVQVARLGRLGAPRPQLGDMGSRRGLGLPVLRARVLVLPCRTASRPRIGSRSVPALGPRVRGRRRIPHRRATRRPAVDRGRHRGRSHSRHGTSTSACASQRALP